MSMMGCWIEISPQLLSEIQRDETVVEQIILGEVAAQFAPGKMEALLEELTSRVQLKSQGLPPELGQELMAQIHSMRTSMAGVKEKPAPEGVRRRIELGKAWHGLHFLMCGTEAGAAPPLGDAVLGGSDVGPDHGYGPVRYLTPAEVAAVADAMAQLDNGTIRSRWNPTAMGDARVYPGLWDQDDALPWLLDSFQELQEFYSLAASRGSAMLLYLT